MNQYIIAAIGFFGFGTLLGALEVVSRKFSLPSESVRRASHISAALFTAFFSLYLSAPLLLLVLSVFSIIMFLSRRLRVFKHIHGVSRRTMGEELLPIGFVLAYLIARGNLAIFIPAILTVGMADPITGIVMQKWNNHILGIIVFVIVAMPILLLTADMTVFLALVIALVVALVERISSYGTDNLSIPIFVALILSQL